MFRVEQNKSQVVLLNSKIGLHKHLLKFTYKAYM